MMKNPYCILKLGDYIVNTEIDEQGKLNPKWKFQTSFIGTFPKYGKLVLMNFDQNDSSKIAEGEFELKFGEF